MLTPGERSLNLGMGKVDAGGELQKAGPAYLSERVRSTIFVMMVELMLCREHIIELVCKDYFLLDIRCLGEDV